MALDINTATLTGFSVNGVSMASVTIDGVVVFEAGLFGTTSMSVVTSVAIDGTVELSKYLSASMTADFDTSATGTVNNTYYGVAHLTSDMTMTVVDSTDIAPKVSMGMDASMGVSASAFPILFEMYVASVDAPSFSNIVGGTLEVVQVTTGNWKVTSENTITHFEFANPNNGVPTEINIVKGETLTSMDNMCDSLSSLTDFTFQGVCNVTSLNYTWSSCSNLVNWVFSDTSSVTTFIGMMSNCSSLQYMPYIDTSSGTDEYAFQTMFNNCSSLLCLTNIDTTGIASSTDTWYMFYGCTSLVAPDSTDQTSITETGIDWVNSGDCPATISEPPTYLLTEDIVVDNGDYFVNNSSTSDILYDGVLEHALQSTQPEGTPWLPTSPQYPENGTIDLNVASGEGIRQIDTQWTPPSNTEWLFMGCYDVVVEVSYKMYAIHYNGDNTCDIYLGDDDTELTLTYSDVPYTPTLGTYKILKDPPEILDFTEIVYTMGTFIVK